MPCSRYATGTITSATTVNASTRQVTNSARSARTAVRIARISRSYSGGRTAVLLRGEGEFQQLPDGGGARGDAVGEPIIVDAAQQVGRRRDDDAGGIVRHLSPPLPVCAIGDQTGFAACGWRGSRSSGR